MLKSFIIAAMVLASGLVTRADAQQSYHPIRTGNDLLQACTYFWSPEGLESQPDATDLSNYTMDMAECGGFFNGVLDTTAVWRGVSTSSQVGFCLPLDNDGRRAAIPEGQIIRITKRWMDQHPAETHKAAAWIIRKALISAFPCNGTTN